MPPGRDFRSKRKLNVVSFKGGKAVKKTSLSVPIRYTVQQATNLPSTSSSTSSNDCVGGDVPLLSPHDEPHGSGFSKTKKARFRKFRIKKKLKAYHERKAKLVASWLNARKQLLTALLSRQELPFDQKCVIPSCEGDARGRCLDCSPGQYLCEGYINIVHAGGKSLHQPEVWKVCYCF